MANDTDKPIMSNKSVIDLTKILRYSNAPTTKDFMALIKQISAMEKQLEAAVDELAAVRQVLAAAKRENHPVRDAMQKVVNAMQDQVLSLQGRLSELKEQIINGCKNAIEAFKDKGVAALDGVARFFKIKPALESIRDSLDKNIAFTDKAVATIEAISTEYHEAGKHLKNIGRTVVGMEAIQDAKPIGNVAKAISAPFRAERRLYASIKKGAESAISSMSRLEEKAKERKPPIKETLEKINKKMEKEKSERPPQIRLRKVERDR